MKTSFQEAFTNHKQGKLTDAKNQYEQILKSEPDNADVWDLLGLLYYQINHFLQ